MANNVGAPSPGGGADRSAVSEDMIFDFRLLLRMLCRRRRTMALVVFLTIAVGMSYTLCQKPSYKSSTRLLISGSKRPGMVSMGSISMPSDLQNLLGSRSVETEVEIISDRELLQEAFDRLSRAERIEAFGASQRVPESAVNVEPRRGTDLVEIGVISHSAATSARMANLIVKVYFEKDLDESSTATRKAREFAQSKMEMISEQLSEAQKEVAHFKRQNQLFAPEAQLEAFTQYTVNLQTERDTALTERAAAQQQLEAIREQLTKEDAEVVSSSIIRQNPRFAAIAATIDELYSKRAELLQEYQAQSPEMASLDNQIQAEEKRLEEMTRTIVDSQVHSRNPIRDALLGEYAGMFAREAAAGASVEVLDQMLDEQTSLAKSFPEKERQLAELQAKNELLEHAYGLISDKYYSLLLTERQNVPRAQVVAEAKPDPARVSPSVPRNAAVFLALGLVLAVMTGLIQAKLDHRIHDPEIAESASGYFAATVIPSVSQVTSPLITRSAPQGMLESFRVLRNNLYFSGLERKLKTIAVTSPARGDGKTTTCLNLAAALAMDAKEVLVVDCNMDHPNLCLMAEKSRGCGLTEVLAGACEIDNALVAGDQENLFLLPAGPLVLNFPEMLNSERGRRVFSQLAERFDYVLLDCPPAANLSDLQMISTLADGVMLIVRLGKTRTPDLEAAMESLAQVSTPVVNLVVNGGADASSASGVRERIFSDDTAQEKDKTGHRRS